MLAQMYTLSFYIAWRMERRNKILKKSMDPNIGNPAIKKLHKALEDFEFENEKIKVHTRLPFGIENFEFESRKDCVIGQWKLTFSVFNKDPETTASNYGQMLAFLLKRIMKIRIETDKAVIQITDYRTPGQIKNDESRWPKNADTVF